MNEEKEVKKRTTGTKKTASTGKKSTTKRSTAAKTIKRATVKKEGASASRKSASTTKSTTKKSPKSTASKRVETKKATTKKSVPKKTTTTKKKTTAVKTSPSKEVVKPVVDESILEEKTVVLPEEIKEVKQEVIEEKKEIPISNYIIVAIVVVWVFIIAFIGFKLYARYEQSLYDEGYFIHEKANIKQISLEEVNHVIHSTSGQFFILFNFRGYEETYRLERELDDIIQEHHLNNVFYYVDLTDEKGQANCTLDCVINSALQTSSYKNTPAIAYYKDGKLIDIAQREDKKVLESADFIKILDMYEIK